MREEAAILDRALAIEPNDVERKSTRALVELDWKADTRPLHQVIEEIRAKNPAAIQSVADGWLVLRTGRARPCCRRQCFSGIGRKQHWQ